MAQQGFGERLAEAMRLRGLGADQLAQETPTSRSRIEAYLKDASPKGPTLDNLVGIVRVLGCSPRYLLMGEGEPYPPPPEATETAMEAVAAWVDWWRESGVEANRPALPPTRLDEGAAVEASVASATDPSNPRRPRRASGGGRK